MSRISRLVVLVTSVAALVGAMSGTANAVTWHVGGTGAFTATGPAATLSATGISLACASTSVTGSYAAGAFVGAAYTGISGSITMSPCFLGGQGYEWSCGYRFTATTQPVTTAVTTGLMDLTCGMTVGSVKSCHLGGSAHVIYTNNVAPTADTFTVTTSTLTIGGPSCIYGSHEPAHLAETRFTVTSNSGNGPHIHRTA